MENTTMLKSLIDGYNEVSYTHNYIFGFESDGVIYGAIATSEVLPYVTSLDKASRGAGLSLRFRPNKAQKEFLKNCETFALCSKKFFEDFHKTSTYNKGENFEQLVTEYYGQRWEKDNVPFTKAGDIEVNGIAFQIKFEKATFCNEKSLRALRG